MNSDQLISLCATIAKYCGFFLVIYSVVKVIHMQVYPPNNNNNNNNNSKRKKYSHEKLQQVISTIVEQQLENATFDVDPYSLLELYQQFSQAKSVDEIDYMIHVLQYQPTQLQLNQLLYRSDCSIELTRYILNMDYFRICNDIVVQILKHQSIVSIYSDRTLEKRLELIMNHMQSLSIPLNMIDQDTGMTIFHILEGNMTMINRIIPNDLFDHDSSIVT
jgi:hypothetical protein